MALSTGQPLKWIDAEVARRTAQQIAEDTEQPLAHFTELKRVLDIEEPGYAE